MAGRGPGRRPKLTKDVEARLLKLLQAGVPKELACYAVGIASRTLRIWLTKAKDGNRQFVGFADKVEQAQAEAQALMLAKIRQHGNKDWRALAWILEHIASERFGYKAQVNVTVESELERILDAVTAVAGPELATQILAALAGERDGAPAPGHDSLSAGTAGAAGSTAGRPN